MYTHCMTHWYRFFTHWAVPNVILIGGYNNRAAAVAVVERESGNISGHGLTALKALVLVHQPSVSPPFHFCINFSKYLTHSRQCVLMGQRLSSEWHAFPAVVLTLDLGIRLLA